MEVKKYNDMSAAIFNEHLLIRSVHWSFVQNCMQPSSINIYRACTYQRIVQVNFARKFFPDLVECTSRPIAKPVQYTSENITSKL
jgi:hypothetical protein